jgi:hypothetical protein
MSIRAADAMLGDMRHARCLRRFGLQVPRIVPTAGERGHVLSPDAASFCRRRDTRGR